MTKPILAIVGLLLLGAGIWLAVANQSQAKAQVAAIIAKDNSGQDTAADLSALKTYAASHTNGSATVTLVAAYERAQAQAKAQAEAGSASAKLYGAAQQACAGRTDSITQARCVADYVSKRLVAAPVPSQIPAPKASDYTFTYSSPMWAPDGAGASLLGGIAAFLLLGFATIKQTRHER